MALIKCSECGRTISDKATACVHCGAPLTEEMPRRQSDSFQAASRGAVRKRHPVRNALIALALIAVFVEWLGSAYSPDKERVTPIASEEPAVPPESTPSRSDILTPPPPPAPPPVATKTQPKVCGNADLQCWGEQNNVQAMDLCQGAVERQAQYDVKWTDGFLTPMFNGFKWFDQKSHAVSFVGDHVKFQNGYGAWSNMIYSCAVSGDGKRVLDVYVTPGRLPE